MPARNYEHLSGFYTTRTSNDRQIPKDAFIEGSKNLLYKDNGTLQNANGHQHLGLFGGSLTYGLEDGWASMGTNEVTDKGAGNIIEYLNKSLLFVGSGNVNALIPSVNPLVQFIGTANSKPQIAVRTKVETTNPDGTINPAGTRWKQARQMGLAIQGSSPLLSIPSPKSAEFSGLLTGSYSVKAAALREETGALSIASPSSNVVEFTGTSSVVQIPPARVDGSNIWRLYFTPKGFGTVGNHLQFPLELLESEVAAGTINNLSYNTSVKMKSIGAVGSRKVEIEFNDQDLLATEAPIDQFPAPDCSFITNLGNQVILIGTFGGIGISSSIPSEPESFPPSLATFVSESILGVSRPQSGFLYLLCRNSIWIAVLSGAIEGSPVIARPLVNQLGVLSNKAAVAVGDELYGFSAGRMPFRINSEGSVDKKFGDKVIDIWKIWNPAEVSVGYDEKYHTVIYSYQNFQMCYYINEDRWSAPIDFTEFVGFRSVDKPNGFIVSTFTQEGVLHIVIWNPVLATYRMFLFDKGTSGSIYSVKTNWDDFDSSMDIKHLFYYRAIVQTPDFKGSNIRLSSPIMMNCAISKDYETADHYSFTYGVSHTRKHLVNYIPIRALHMKVFSLKLFSSGLGHRIHRQELFGEISSIMPNF